MITCQRIMNANGLAVPNWPVEWGGKDWTPMQRYIFTEEVLSHDVPAPLPFNTAMVGPVIAHFGTQAQKEKFLPATANMDIWWCQGFLGARCGVRSGQPENARGAGRRSSMC